MENNQKKKWFNVFDFVYYKGERLSRKGWRCGGEMLFIFMWITVSFAAGNISRLQILHTDYALYGGPVVIFYSVICVITEQTNTTNYINNTNHIFSMKSLKS